MPDYREIGARLSGADVDRLRQAVTWVRTQHGLRMNDIAAAAGVEEHTLRNFVSGKSQRPADVFLGRQDAYFRSNSNLLPADFLANEDASSRPQVQGVGKFVRQGDIERLLPISERDLMRIYDRYSGAYLCFGLSYDRAKFTAAWMRIRSYNPQSREPKRGVPVPRFTVLMKYPDRIDPGVSHPYGVGGLVTARNGMLFLLGHHDGDLKYMALREPSVPRFTYLRGVALLTSANDRQPFAIRALCQYLGRRARRRDWEDRIGVYSAEDFARTFDNADDVMNAIGDSGVLKGFDPG